MPLSKWSEKLPQPLRKNGLMLLGIAGILLICFSDLLFPSSEKTEAAPTTSQQQALQLQTQLEELLAQIEGTGEVSVMLTLESESEQIYAQDERTQSQSGQSGGAATNTFETSHVILNTHDGDAPLVETTYLPQVRGVAVVCQGGEDITVVTRITEAVSVVLDLPASRICVTKMN